MGPDDPTSEVGEILLSLQIESGIDKTVAPEAFKLEEKMDSFVAKVEKADAKKVAEEEEKVDKACGLVKKVEKAADSKVADVEAAAARDEKKKAVRMLMFSATPLRNQRPSGSR